MKSEKRHTANLKQKQVSSTRIKRWGFHHVFVHSFFFKVIYNYSSWSSRQVIANKLVADKRGIFGLLPHRFVFQ